MEPWLTRHMYVHVGGHGDFLRFIFSRAIETYIDKQIFAFRQSFSI